MAAFRGDYQVVLYDTDGNQLDLLDMQRMNKLEYTRVLNDFGVCSLTIPASDSASAYFGTVDMLIGVYRRNSQGAVFVLEDTYLARYYNRFIDEEQGAEYIIISGLGLEHLLARRIILVTDDPLGADGYSTKYAASDLVMESFVDNQCINPNVNANRIIQGLGNGGAGGTGNPVFQRRQSGDNLLDVLKEIAVIAQMDFRIVHLGAGVYSFLAQVRGTNRTKAGNYPFNPYVVFDPARMNVRACSVTIDRKNEKTLAYVAGQGTGNNRTFYPVATGIAEFDSDLNRIEVTVNGASNADDLDGMTAAGYDTLRQYQANIELTFTPELGAPQGCYNVDWFLGDRVTGKYGGYEANFRINQISVSVADDESVSIELLRWIYQS